MITQTITLEGRVYHVAAHAARMANTAAASLLEKIARRESERL